MDHVTHSKINVKLKITHLVFILVTLINYNLKVVIINSVTIVCVVRTINSNLGMAILNSGATE